MSYVGILYSHRHVHQPQIQAWEGDPSHPRNHVHIKDRSLLFLGDKNYNVPGSKNGWKKYESVGTIKIRWAKEGGVGKLISLS